MARQRHAKNRRRRCARLAHLASARCLHQRKTQRANITTAHSPPHTAPSGLFKTKVLNAAGTDNGRGQDAASPAPAAALSARFRHGRSSRCAHTAAFAACCVCGKWLRSDRSGQALVLARIAVHHHYVFSPLCHRVVMNRRRENMKNSNGEGARGRQRQSGGWRRAGDNRATR